MREYPKIQSLYKRDDRGRFIDGDWSTEAVGFLAGNEWEWTEKVDGTNIRLGFEHGCFRGNEHAWVAGRTDNAQIPPHLLSRLVELQQAMPWEEVFPDTDVSVTLYGEGYGAKIQKGGQYLSDRCDFVLFDVLVGDWWLKRPDVEAVARNLGLDVVPVVGTGTLFDAVDAVKSGIKSAWPEARAEGLVCRPLVQLFDRKGERVVVKVKAKDLAS